MTAQAPRAEDVGIGPPAGPSLTSLTGGLAATQSECGTGACVPERRLEERSDAGAVGRRWRRMVGATTRDEPQGSADEDDHNDS